MGALRKNYGQKLGLRRDMSTKTQILLPDSHLSSPLILHKLLYYWRLSGLPLPLEHEHDDLIATRNWYKIASSNEDTIQRCIATGKLAHQYLNHHKPIIPICHPRTLPWLTHLQSTDVRKKFFRIADLIRTAVQRNKGKFIELTLQVQERLGRRRAHEHHSTHSNLTAQTSQEFNSLCKQPDIWFTGLWSEAKMIWLQIKQMNRFMVLSARSGTLRHNCVTLNLDKGVVIISTDLIVIINQVNNTFTCLYPEMVLMYSDMLEGRSATAMFTQMIEFLEPLHDRIQDLLQLVDSVFEQLGNPGYEIVALLESMAYASVQLHEPTSEYVGQFFKFNLGELYDILVNKMGYDTTCKLISIISRIYSGLTEDQGAEMLCMLRHWGHPLLSARQAAGKVRESMCTPKVLDSTTIFQVLSFFNCMIINGYRKANSGLWPKISPGSIISDTVRQLYVDSAEIPYSIMLSHYKELAQIDFLPSITPDPVSDLSMFLKDKAIARPKEQWLSSFRQNLLEQDLLRSRHCIPGSNRLLVEFLESSDFDPYEEMQYLNSLEYLRDDQVSVSYSLKEKEVKVDGRIFAKLTKKLRNCQVMAEGMLAAEVAPFFKGNGVIQDQISLTKTMLTMSQLSLNCNRGLLHSSRERIGLNRRNRATTGKKARVATFLTTDLQKYCTNWRYQSIKLFARTLNRLFGFNHFFEWIHLRLMNLTMYVGDPFNPPTACNGPELDDQQNEDIFIISARGGIEGLCQKLWSMISIAAINLAATKANCRVACMVQGDNQVIAVTKEVTDSTTWEQAADELHQISDLFFDELIKVNHGLGHNLKLRETIRSDTLFVYSKRIFKDGRILSQMLKNASKLVLISGDLSENIPSSCGNISSTITRICENGAPKDFCYLLNYIMCLTEVLFDCNFSIISRTEPESYRQLNNNLSLLSAYVLTPTQVGGLNNLQYSRLYARNIGDPATAAFADLRRLITVGLVPERVLNAIINRKPGDGTWLTLCSDPYALNLPLSGDPGIILKKHTQSVLFETCSNPLLAGVYSDDHDSEEMRLARSLLDQPLVHPRVAHAILECSSIGRRKQIQGLVDTTTTIIKIAIDRKPLSLRKLQKIVNYSSLHVQYFIDELWSQDHPRNPLVNVETCSLTLSAYCRTQSWRNLLGGRPIQGVGCPDVLEMLHGHILSLAGACQACNSGDTQFTWLHLPSGVDLSNNSESNPALRIPYLGSKTQERRTASLARIASMSPHIKAALRGSSLVVWAFGESEHNWEYAHRIALSRCEISMEHLKLLTPMPTSGNLQHRLDDGITQTVFTPASLYRVAPYVHISNDSQRLFEENSAKESNIVYQQVMLTGLGFIESLFPLGTNSTSEELTLHLHTGSSCCIREVDLAEPFDLQGGVPEISAVKHNRFMFDPDPFELKERTTLDIKVFKSYEMNLESYSTFDLMTVLASSTGKMIGQSIVSYDSDTSIKNDAIILYDNSRNWISEGQNCDIVQLLEYAALEIMLDCAYQAYYLRIAGVQALLMYMNDLLSNMPGLLLGNIAATISHPIILDRLYLVGLVDYRQVPQLANLDFIALASEVLIKCLKRVLLSLSSGKAYDLLFPSTIEDNLDERMFNLLARYNCLLCLIFSSQKELPIIRGLNAEEKCRTINNHLNLMKTVENLSPAQLTLINEPQVVTFPTNLYYMSRKSLNIIRDRPDRRAILDCIFPTPDLSDLQLCIPTWPQKDDPFLDGAMLIRRDLTPNVEIRKLESLESTGGGESQQVVCLNDSMLRYLFRGVGISSTSWYKASSLLSEPEVRLTRGGNALYLAEGSGSVMSLIEHYLPHKRIFYNSLFSNTQNPPQRHFGPTPTQFLESVPFKNIQAQIACSEGYVQEFEVLWRECQPETDLTRDACVNFICQRVAPLSIQFLHCDLELGNDVSWEVTRTALVNVFSILSQCVCPKGVSVLKTRFSRVREFSFLHSLLWTSSHTIRIISNGYAARGDLECYIVAVKGDQTYNPPVQDVVCKVSQLDANNLTLLSRHDERELMKDFITQIRACNHIYQSPMSLIIKCLLKQSDQALFAVGGQPTRPLTADLRAGGSAVSFLALATSHLETTLKSVVYFRDEQNLVDTVFLLTPYNLKTQGKIRTLLQQVTRQLFEIKLISISADQLQDVQQMLSIILKSTICINDLITVKTFIHESKIRKYLVRRLGKSGISNCFHDQSKIVLTRAEQKYYLKILGNAIKGYYA
uniref:RNA-directed RNA polymerase L n=1 Tax=Avulavirus sp. TaxID=2493083 RepID=A0A481XX66_9MONO|nr:L [Avulavirus sp.] [Avulavirus sp.]